MGPTEITLNVISGRWKVMVIFWLLQEKRRFNQLQRGLSSITHRTLVKQLKEMEADGLVEREDFGEIPPESRVSADAARAVAGAGASGDARMGATAGWRDSSFDERELKRKRVSQLYAERASIRSSVPTSVIPYPGGPLTQDRTFSTIPAAWTPKKPRPIVSHASLTTGLKAD